ncbi:MAG: hypothetical protein M3547_04290 [Acidobacteriota bacterium]|nr:hypothetical protein [Acidobacteriota bacterium]
MWAYGGDRVEEGDDGRVSLTSSSSKGWRGRSPAIAYRRSAHPGTTVSWEGALYEVMEARPLASGDVLYSLAPWDDAQAIRTLERYDAPSEEARARERTGRANAVKKRRAAILLSPLLGHLPGVVQERMESEFGAPANTMTIVSAAPLFVVGILGLFAAFTRAVGGSPEPLPEPSLPVSLYLALESYSRLSIVATQSRPAGSLPGALLYEIWRRIRS